MDKISKGKVLQAIAKQFIILDRRERYSQRESAFIFLTEEQKNCQEYFFRGQRAILNRLLEDICNIHI